ncbi:hypothetical protein [Sphingomonas hankookensis]|uniref:hypothetical protein n=1 Tax=Sphingomonas hankookensis TaxID=563996 RepID=UPI003D302F4C
MTKQEQFLWVVQTLSIHNAINLSTDPERRDKYRHEISPTGAFMNCDEALRASTLIPEKMSAIDAANEFFFFIASNLRDSEDKANGKRSECPEWFVRRPGRP